MKNQRIKLGIIAALSLIIIIEGVYIFHKQIKGFSTDGESGAAVSEEAAAEPSETDAPENTAAAGAVEAAEEASASKIIVLDPGHGKPSSLMSDEEKSAEGYEQKDGAWGEWRHWKNGTSDQECYGSGCHGDYECWYPIGNGDRDTEPELNLRNALAAKEYLENTYGYEVRITRTSNDENPSFSKRVSYCYPDNDLSGTPDADCYVCIHSNAGGGSGSAYIEAEGDYTQKFAGNLNSALYVAESNALGKLINDRIVLETSMSRYGEGVIREEGYLILFNKCPVPAGYIEIGFFDNSTDLTILNMESNEIGKAIAEGINDFLEGNG